jgi:hypothetical protein
MNIKNLNLKQEQTLSEVSLSNFSCPPCPSFPFYSPKGSFQVVELLLVTKVK